MAMVKLSPFISRKTLRVQLTLRPAFYFQFILLVVKIISYEVVLL
jgi:hypothetical protein